MLTAPVTVDPAFRIGPADRRLFGSFVEHMGRCVYGGVYEPGHPSADARGFRLSQEASDYLMHHVRRDMPSLLALLDALDRYSLERKRAITVPLLRELLEGDSNKVETADKRR